MMLSTRNNDELPLASTGHGLMFAQTMDASAPSSSVLFYDAQALKPLSQSVTHDSVHLDLYLWMLVQQSADLRTGDF